MFSIQKTPIHYIEKTEPDESDSVLQYSIF